MSGFLLKKRILMSICLMMTLFQTFPGFAELTIKPMLITSVRLDDNFFLSEDNGQEVFTYLLQPGMALGYTEANSLVKLDYTLDSHSYDDRESDLLPGQRSAAEDNFTGHTLKASGRYRAFKRLLMGIDDDFYVTRDPAQSDRFNNSVSREKYTLNRIAPMLFYDFGEKFTVGMRYRNMIFDYANSYMEDSTSNGATMDLIYNFNRTLALDMEYQHAAMDYDMGTPDYTTDQFKLIFKKTLRLFVLDIGAGYNKRSFDTVGTDKIDGFVYHLNIATASNLLSGPRFELNYDTNYNEIGNTTNVEDSYYLAHRLSLKLIYDLSKNLSAGIGGYYQISDYVESSRKDKTLDISPNISYMLTRWLVATVSGGYANRSSSIDGYDYDNVYITAMLNASHDFGKK